MTLSLFTAFRLDSVYLSSIISKTLIAIFWLSYNPPFKPRLDSGMHIALVFLVSVLWFMLSTFLKDGGKEVGLVKILVAYYFILRFWFHRTRFCGVKR